MAKKSTVLFEKEYDGESVVDLPEDVSEALLAEYNPAAAALPVDEYGFWSGRIIVRIEHQEE